MVYLLTDPEKPLPQATEKRVRTLQTLEGLGACSPRTRARPRRAGGRCGRSRHPDRARHRHSPRLRAGGRDPHRPLSPARPAEQEWEASDLANEIADRFGPLPDQVRDLVDFCAIRSQCASASVAKVEAGPNGIAVTFAGEDARAAAEKASLEGLGTAKWAGERLVLQIATEQPRQRIEAIRKILGVIQEA